MAALMLCPACQRHVRSDERACPFCDSSLSLREPVAELRLVSRLDRSSLFTLGAALSAAGLALGCSGTAPANPEPATPAEPPPTVAPVYGAPAPPPGTSDPAPAPTTAPAPPPASPDSPPPAPPPGPVSPTPIAPAYGGPPKH